LFLLFRLVEKAPAPYLLHPVEGCIPTGCRRVDSPIPLYRAIHPELDVSFAK